MKQPNDKLDKPHIIYYRRKLNRQPEDPIPEVISPMENAPCPALATVQKEEVFIDYNQEKQRIPFQLDLSSAPHEEEIEWERNTPLTSAIRAQQAFFFIFLREVLTTEISADIAYFSLDIPLLIEKKFQLVRYIDFPKQGCFRLFRLKRNTDWEGEPLFPRIGMEENGRFIEREIPKACRLAALEAYYKAINSREAPFKPSPTYLLKTILENPALDSRKLSEKVNLSPNTINNHYKKIIEIARDRFGISFAKGKLVATYWHEMGLAFPTTR